LGCVPGRSFASGAIARQAKGLIANRNRCPNLHGPVTIVAAEEFIAAIAAQADFDVLARFAGEVIVGSAEESPNGSPKAAGDFRRSAAASGRTVKAWCRGSPGEPPRAGHRRSRHTRGSSEADGERAYFRPESSRGSTR